MSELDEETKRLIRKYEGELRRLLRKLEKGGVKGEIRVKRVKLDLEKAINGLSEELARLYCPNRKRLCIEAFRELCRRFVTDDVVALVEEIKGSGLDVETAMAIYLVTRDLGKIREYIEGRAVPGDLAEQVNALLDAYKEVKGLDLMRLFRLKR